MDHESGKQDVVFTPDIVQESGKQDVIYTPDIIQESGKQANRK
jgi:hypothetical protein